MSTSNSSASSSSLITNLIRPEILAQTSYHVQDATNMVKLDTMENPYPLPLPVKALLGEHLAKVALNRYPVPAYGALKQKMCQHFGVPAGFDIILGNGSDELITMLSVACAKPGAKVLAPVPTFVMYASSAELAGMQFIGVPLQDDFSLDLPAMLLAIKQHQPSLVYLSNPNNPTGSWFDEKHIIQIIHAMDGVGLVVVDEAYQPFAHGTIIPRLSEFPNLAVICTVSKLGLAGLRLGYMSAMPALLAEFDKVRPPYNINVLTEAAMDFLLDHMALFDEQASLIRAQRRFLLSELQKIAGMYVYPSSANFLLVKVISPLNAEIIFAKLIEHNILVKNVGRMHKLLDNCLRVTVGTPSENQLFIGALSDIVNSLSNP